MQVKTITIAAAALSVFAFEAHAQVKETSKPTSETLKGCVMYSGEVDENCDGVADGRATEATDYNSSRSNKSYSVLDTGPDDGSQDQDAEDAGATDYNSSRSNKADGIIANDPKPDPDEEETKATDYNSSRSNKSF